MRTEIDDVSIDASDDDGRTESATPSVPSFISNIAGGKPWKEIGESDIGSKTVSADLEFDQKLT